MSNRYVTSAEKAGTQRRQAAYRERLKESGLRARSLTLTNDEDARMREILNVWRDESHGLTDDLKDAAIALKPPKG
jgi:hypothetical protein